MTSGPDSPRLLFVCTANICRSPSAEALARQRHGEGRLTFRSAGFLAGDRECPALLLQTLREHGIDASRHRSYQIDEATLAAADLVLTMEGEHVQQATMLLKPAFPKIVPLREAAQVIGGLGRARVDVPQFIEVVNRSRNPSSYLSTDWDVEDPFNRKLKDYRRVVAELVTMVDTVVTGIS